MKVIKIISFSVLFLALQLVPSVNRANNYEKKIQEYESNLTNPNISQNKRLKIQKKLLDFYWFSPNRKRYFQKIYILCLDIMNNNDKGYAPYILGEMYYYGYTVTIDLGIARNYFQQYIANSNDDLYTFLANLMINQIDSYIRMNYSQLNEIT